MTTTTTAELWRRGVKPVIARRGTEHGSGLVRVRWVVERTFAWLHNFSRLRIRWERDAGLHYAFLRLGCSLICWRHIRP
jgi:transposase